MDIADPQIAPNTNTTSSRSTNYPNCTVLAIFYKCAYICYNVQIQQKWAMLEGLVIQASSRTLQLIRQTKCSLRNTTSKHIGGTYAYYYRGLLLWTHRVARYMETLQIMCHTVMFVFTLTVTGDRRQHQIKSCVTFMWPCVYTPHLASKPSAKRE